MHVLRALPAQLRLRVFHSARDQKTIDVESLAAEFRAPERLIREYQTLCRPVCTKMTLSTPPSVAKRRFPTALAVAAIRFALGTSNAAPDAATLAGQHGVSAGTAGDCITASRNIMRFWLGSEVVVSRGRPKALRQSLIETMKSNTKNTLEIIKEAAIKDHVNVNNNDLRISSAKP